MSFHFPRYLLAVSGLALTLAAGPGAAQQSHPQTANANQNAPLKAPDSVAKRAQVMPDSFADLVEQVSPAVVNITTTSVVSTPVSPFPGLPENSPFSDFFREFGFPNMPQGRHDYPGGPMRQQRSNALGSGFVISSDGYIVTNNHVIDGADEIEIEFKDGHKRPAKVIGTDPKTDIALLKAEGHDLPFVTFGNSDKARVGDWVLALGNPLGQGFSASSGIVSARNRELSGTYDDFLQTDAAINRGNSGGPLFNMDGEVVGVNTAILTPNGGSIGIGFSMASNVVSKVVEQLKEYGETRRGWLGVKIQDVTHDMADALGIDGAHGAMVTDVLTGPAAQAGIKAGDVIVSFAGIEVSDTRDLIRRVGTAHIGEAIDLTVLRNGKRQKLSVTLGRREVAEGTADGDDGGDVLGMTLVPLTPQIAAEMGIEGAARGLLVREVAPEGAAADKGIAVGDIIIEANQAPVKSRRDLKAAMTEAKKAGRKSVLLLIRRGDSPRFLALPVDPGK